MSEELIQKNLVEAPEKMGDWNFYNIGATTLKALKGAKIIPDKDYDEFEAKKPDALIVKKASINKSTHVGQPVFSVLFALLSLAGDSPPASKRTKIPRKSKAVRCEAVLPEQKCSQTRKSPQRILCVFSRALTPYEGISARQNRVCPCQSTQPLVIAAIEYKVPSQLRTEKQIEKAISQELGTAQALQAKVYIITDGKKSIWVNPANGHEILQEDGSKITLNFDKTSAECIVLINKIRASINATNDTLKAAASVDPLPLAEKIWQDLWAVSGATPENCLYTFVEIFKLNTSAILEYLKACTLFMTS